EGVGIGPLDCELQFGRGLCAVYEAGLLERQGRKREAHARHATSAGAMLACRTLDQEDAGWTHEDYLPSATRESTWLPSSPAELGRLFLVQAVSTGLSANSRTWQWGRLVKDIIAVYRKDMRELCQKARPGDDNYNMKLMARLQFALVDKD